MQLLLADLILAHLVEGTLKLIYTVFPIKKAHLVSSISMGVKLDAT
jgi:hypothetical protein